MQNRRDLVMLYKKNLSECLDLIYKAVQMSGCKNVVFSGGYGLNCVANYYYLESLKKDGINFYAEPKSNDARQCAPTRIITVQYSQRKES